jgi:hypothetical protein
VKQDLNNLEEKYMKKPAILIIFISFTAAVYAEETTELSQFEKYETENNRYFDVLHTTKADSTTYHAYIVYDDSAQGTIRWTKQYALVETNGKPPIVLYSHQPALALQGARCQETS